MSTVESAVVELVKKASHPKKPDLSDVEKPLLDSGLDSLDFAVVLMEIEEHFSIKIPVEEIDNLRSVSSIVDYVGRVQP